MLSPPPPSVLREYGLIDETDDALARPVEPPVPEQAAGESDADFAARALAHDTAWNAAREKFAADYLRATETGDWTALLVEGKKPTIFHVRQVGVMAWQAFKRLARSMSDEEFATLAFRLGVVSIDNLPLGIQLKRVPYVTDDGRRERALGDVLAEEVVDAIGLAPGGKGVLYRLGVLVMQQRGAPLGK